MFLSYHFQELICTSQLPRSGEAVEFLLMEPDDESECLDWGGPFGTGSCGPIELRSYVQIHGRAGAVLQALPYNVL